MTDRRFHMTNAELADAIYEAHKECRLAFTWRWDEADSPAAMMAHAVEVKEYAPGPDAPHGTIVVNLIVKAS